MPSFDSQTSSSTARRIAAIRRSCIERASALAAGTVLAALAACGGGHIEPYTPGGTSAVPALAASAGAQGVVVADAPLARPGTAPCTVPLYAGIAFQNFDAHPFAYAGTSGCTGTPAKIVLEADFSVNAGRQFDRTASIAIGGVNLYFGTTQEPSATVAPSWHVERDVTEYANALKAATTGHARLDNLVDGTYTGVITGSARLVYYPATGTADAATRRIADLVVPFAGDLTTGDPASVTAAGSPLQRTLSLPTNLVGAYLDVQAESQAGDEFWQTCVPDALTSTLQSCGGGAFREVLVSIDGQPAGIAPVVPRVYTGGIDPGLWRPTPGVETLNFIPSRVDLTPYAGALSDGQPHTLAITVEGAQDHFAVVGNLLLYRDPTAATTGGAVSSNTLGQALTAPVTTQAIVTGADGAASGPVGVTAARSYAVEGYVDTSAGRVTTRVAHALAFSNQQTFAIDAAAYTQNVMQTSTDDGTVTTTRADGSATVDTIALAYPLTVSYTFDNTANTQTTTLSQAITNAVVRQSGGKQVFASHFANTVQANSQLVIDSSGAAKRGPQSGTQQVHYGDTLGSCFDRQIATAANALTTATDATGCAGGNVLNWLSPSDGSPPQGVLAQISGE